jgi:tripartite motif-containing protein 2/3
MSSTLIETVSINYEDFTDSFLTCGTCLLPYDASEHAPKLLPCSHTVCRSCLEHIVETDTATVRCPICRETIIIPRGGITAFPASFIVNQLLDLMSRQRRDVVPKCSQHAMQELMFCETCDAVFCVDCSGGTHSGRGMSAHTVIPFSIAIKRMSEILLYKASQCMRNLNAANEVVNSEMQKLDIAAEKCAEAIARGCQEIVNLFERRQHELLQLARKVHDEKKRALKEQLDIIDAEKFRVEQDCQGLQQQVEVRSITKRISDLNEKLDMSSTLLEPRENAFMQFDYKHNNALDELTQALSRFGKIRISTTFPPLCTATAGILVCHLKCIVTITAVDFHGNMKTSGGDPVTASLQTEKGEAVPFELLDLGTGTYTVTFQAKMPGKHKMCINIFDRPIKDSPLALIVSEHNNPVMKIGRKGSGNLDLLQPVSVVSDASDNMFILDTGNNRIKVLDSAGNFLRHLVLGTQEQQSTTGIALAPGGHSLFVVNWRTRAITELMTDTGAVVQRFTHADLTEPVSIAMSKQNEIFVADNGLKQVIVFDRQGNKTGTVGSQGQFKLVTSMAVGANGELVIVDGRVQAFSTTGGGKLLYDIKADGGMKGQFGAVTLDSSGNILATFIEKGRGIVHVYNAARQLLFSIDSFDDRLSPRASGLATLSTGHAVVADLGNNCVKMYRYL